MVLNSCFRGLVAPVFTPLDTEGQVNLSVIPKYAQYLSSKKVDAVLVNGTVGEGALMSNDERKKVTESWMQAAKSTGQKVMVHVGATNLNNVVQLAEHAESMRVWAILCLPDLFFRPTTVSEVIDYLKIVSSAAPKTPLFYYHYPTLTGVALDVVKLLDSAYSQVPTLTGVKYTHNNLDEGIRCVQLQDHVFTIFLGCDQLSLPAFSLGFDSMILTVLNFSADQVHQIKEFVHKGDNVKARKIQKKITDLAYFVMDEMQWINGFKKVTSLITGLELGSPRAPLKPLTLEQIDRVYKELKKGEWL